MRMQHIYQPVMLLILLDTEDGWASDHQIVEDFEKHPNALA
jgi:hypothetical protein